ncbi:MAG TPA: hypothetical protein VGO03_07595 [Acidimicrobiia bacterium]|jgi:hypothetical protein
MSDVDATAEPVWRNRLYEHESGWRVAAGVALTLATWWFGSILPDVGAGIGNLLLLAVLVAMLARRVGWTRWTARVSTWVFAVVAMVNTLRVLNERHGDVVWFIILATIIVALMARFAWWAGLRFAYRRDRIPSTR